MKILFVCDVIADPTLGADSLIPAVETLRNATNFQAVWVISGTMCFGYAEVTPAQLGDISADIRMFAIKTSEIDKLLGDLSVDARDRGISKMRDLGVDAADTDTLRSIFALAIAHIQPGILAGLQSRLKKDFGA